MKTKLLVLAALLLLTTLTSLPVDGRRQTRIRNGNEAGEHSVPSIASLQNNGVHFCGGSLIAPTWIVTAAHCVIHKTRVSERYKAVLGEHNLNANSGKEQRVSWKRVILHPRYRGTWGGDDHRYHDIALIELRDTLHLNQYVKLASVSRDPDDNVNKEDCLIVGWGRTDPNRWTTRKLQKARMEIVPTDQCFWKDVMISGQVCIKDMNPGARGHSSACFRDSGGPLMCGKDFQTLKGAAAYVYPGCDGKEPNVYTKLSGYIDWIEQHTGPLQAGCPAGFEKLGGKCYAWVSSALNWAGAVAHCKTLGGVLAEPKTSEEFSIIKQLALDNQITGNLWLGGNLGGQWTWDSSGDAITYLPWYSGEPNNSGRCLHLWQVSPGQLVLDDHRCEATGAFVCQA